MIWIGLFARLAVNSHSLCFWELIVGFQKLFPPGIINFPKLDQVAAHICIADFILICTPAWLHAAQAWSKCIKPAIHHYFYLMVTSRAFWLPVCLQRPTGSRHLSLCMEIFSYSMGKWSLISKFCISISNFQIMSCVLLNLQRQHIAVLLNCAPQTSTVTGMPSSALKDNWFIELVHLVSE